MQYKILSDAIAVGVVQRANSLHLRSAQACFLQFPQPWTLYCLMAFLQTMRHWWSLWVLRVQFFGLWALHTFCWLPSQFCICSLAAWAAFRYCNVFFVSTHCLGKCYDMRFCLCNCLSKLLRMLGGSCWSNRKLTKGRFGNQLCCWQRESQNGILEKDCGWNYPKWSLLWVNLCAKITRLQVASESWFEVAMLSNYAFSLPGVSGT